MVLTKKMTYEEFRYMEIPDGDTSVYELINGNIMRRSSPHSEHQIIVGNIYTKIRLFADEKQFPELANPVQMNVDTKGRLWVAAWKDYPKVKPKASIGTCLEKK